MPLHLTLREAPQFAWECAGLRPDLLADGPALAVGQLPVLVGRETLPLGDLFNVRGQADDGEVIMEGDLSGCRRLGAGMASGTLRVRGPVGPFLGVEMKGGLIDVDGPAGDWAGAEMRGGILRIQGDAADHLGAALPGSRLGMRGGTVLVHGNAGSMVGLAMRRGLIAIAGTVGDDLGHSLIAGTIAVFGAFGRRAGAGMKRGTLWLAGRVDADVPPWFRFACLQSPLFLELYRRRLLELGFPVTEAVVGPHRRYNGDVITDGIGEVLVPH